MTFIQEELYTLHEFTIYSYLNSAEALGSQPSLTLEGDVSPLPVEQMHDDCAVVLTHGSVELRKRT